MYYGYLASSFSFHSLPPITSAPLFFCFPLIVVLYTSLIFFSFLFHCLSHSLCPFNLSASLLFLIPFFLSSFSFPFSCLDLSLLFLYILPHIFSCFSSSFLFLFSLPVPSFFSCLFPLPFPYLSNFFPLYLFPCSFACLSHSLSLPPTTLLFLLPSS